MNTWICLSLSLSLSAFALGCSGSQPKQADGEDEFGSATGGAATPAPDSTSPSSNTDSTPPSSGGEGEGRLNKEQKEQIAIALRRGLAKAVQCPAVVPGAPGGEGTVKVTFDGKKGRSVDASVGPPWVGTPIEACIKRAYIDEIIVPFDGGPLDMQTTVKLAAPPPVDKKPGKPPVDNQGGKSPTDKNK